MEDEHAALIVLASSPLSYQNFVQSFIIGNDFVSLKEVRSSLNTRGLRPKASVTCTIEQVAGLIANESNEQGNSGRKSKKSSSKDPKPSDVYYCKKRDIRKKNILKDNKEINLGLVLLQQQQKIRILI